METMTLEVALGLADNCAKRNPRYPPTIHCEALQVLARWVRRFKSKGGKK